MERKSKLKTKAKSKTNLKAKSKANSSTNESPTLFEELRKIKIHGPKDLSIRSL